MRAISLHHCPFSSSHFKIVIEFLGTNIWALLKGTIAFQHTHVSLKIPLITIFAHLPLKRKIAAQHSYVTVPAVRICQN